MTKTIEDLIQYSLEVHEECIPVRGNVLASGDDDEDKRAEDEVIERLNRGEVWAWCAVTVRAHIPGIDLEGSDHLGGCSYKDAEEFKAENYTDMCANARAELLGKIDFIKLLVRNDEIARQARADYAADNSEVDR